MLRSPTLNKQKTHEGSPVITVLLADSHVLYRAGMRCILEEAGCVVVAEAATGRAALGEALRTRPEVVLMDVHIPEPDGIKVTRQLQRVLPETDIVLITATPDDRAQLARAMRAGARSCLDKDEDIHLILQAVRGGLLGAGLGQTATPPARRSPKRGLTRRETQTLRLVAEGLHSSEIATELGVSTRTVSNHVAAIYRKLSLRTRAHAIVYAVKEGLVSP
jgi:DNA-binding NarL/FixJ family response regulator